MRRPRASGGTGGRVSLLIATESVEAWGAEHSLRELIANAPASWDVELLVDPRSPLRSWATELPVTVTAHRYAKHPVLQTAGSLKRATPAALIGEVGAILSHGLRLRRKMRSADLVLGFSLWQCPEVFLACLLGRTPMMIDIHDNFDGRIARGVVSLLARLTSGALSPSRHLLEEYGIAHRATSHMVPRPVALTTAEWPERSPAGHRPLVVGIVGQISPHKRVDVVVEAVESLGGLPVRLLVVGGRPAEQRTDYEDGIRRRVAGLGHGSMVVDRVSDLRPVLSRCDVVVNVSTQEAFGRTIVEAIAGGALPVVLAGTGPAEIVSDTGIGIVLETTEDLASTIISLAEGGIRDHEALSGPRRDAALEAYRPERVAQEYFDALAAGAR